MAGSLDVVGDMLRFVGLRGVLSDSHPLVYLWRRIAPWLIGRSTTNRQAIATHYELVNDFYLEFLDATRCYSQAVFERDDEALETAQLRKLDFAVESCGLKPGDRVYLDASAFREKYVKPSFVSRYIFPGDHSYFCLHDFLAAVAKTPLDVLAVYNDRHSYYLTCRVWAENLEAARDEVIRRWGEALYRRFRLYLWGSGLCLSEQRHGGLPGGPGATSGRVSHTTHVYSQAGVKCGKHPPPAHKALRNELRSRF